MNIAYSFNRRRRSSVSYAPAFRLSSSSRIMPWTPLIYYVSLPVVHSPVAHSLLFWCPAYLYLKLLVGIVISVTTILILILVLVFQGYTEHCPFSILLVFFSCKGTGRVAFTTSRIRTHINYFSRKMLLYIIDYTIKWNLNSCLPPSCTKSLSTWYSIQLLSRPCNMFMTIL